MLIFASHSKKYSQLSLNQLFSSLNYQYPTQQFVKLFLWSILVILYVLMSLAGDSLQKRQLFSDQPRLLHRTLDIVKLFDGFFLANIAAVKDTEFVYNNKITLIVNCAPQQIRLEFPRITIISFQFGKHKEGPRLNIASLMDVLAKIDCSLFEKCEGVVLLGKGIQNRTITLALLYTMIKFRWSLSTAWKLLQIKRQNINMAQNYYKMLQEIDANHAKGKLSEAIQGNNAQEERIILQNTLKNSQYKNMPNFFGLSYRKETSNLDTQSNHIRKVSFTNPNHQIINPIHPEKRKTNNFQKKLRQFIRQKCQTNQEQTDRYTTQLQSHDQCIMIKNKDIVGRIPRRKIASKTQQSPSRDLREERSPSFTVNNFIQQKQGSPPRRSAFSQLNVPAFHMQLSFFGLSEQESFETNRKQKIYFLNSKKAKVPKKCITEDSYSQLNSKKQENELNGLKAQPGNLFKITKSNKNSYKKIKARPIGKQSDKCIRVQIEQDSTYNRPQKVYNVNLNLQIENINFSKELQRESKDKEKEQKPRMFARQHPKKISRILRSQLQEQI